MFKRFFIILILAASGFLTDSFAQKFDFDDNDLFEWYADARPFIELNYGLVEAKQKQFDGSFSKLGLGEIKLGYSTVDIYAKDYILFLDDKYVFASNISHDLRSNSNNTNVNSKAWRFGLGRRDGYGYSIGSVSIMPYHQKAFVWTRVDFTDVSSNSDVTNIVLSDNDKEILKRYDESFRFGGLSDGGLRLEFGGLVALSGSYEATVVFPRHLFWKWALSYVIEGLGYLSIDYFVEEIMDSSPAAGPIVNFLLKNGLSYAFYALQREDMNWPFSTESPLTYETIKIGLTFSF